MSVEEKAKAVFAKVRERYKGSLKSSNKNYDLTAIDSSALEKASRRNTNANLGYDGRGRQTASVNASWMADAHKTDSAQKDVNIGSVLWHQNATILNCEELTQMCCYWAHSMELPCWYGYLTPDADHATCLVGSVAGIRRQLSDTRIRDYAKITTPDVWIVDAWLGTVCRIGDYPAQVSDKLRAWAQAGKRVNWVPKGADDDVWDTPGGDYRTVFLDAYIELNDD